jgi:hypothetical protein
VGEEEVGEALADCWFVSKQRTKFFEIYPTDPSLYLSAFHLDRYSTGLELQMGSVGNPIQSASRDFTVCGGNSRYRRRVWARDAGQEEVIEL